VNKSFLLAISNILVIRTRVLYILYISIINPREYFANCRSQNNETEGITQESHLI
jgi:hypothetical protein